MANFSPESGPIPSYARFTEFEPATRKPVELTSELELKMFEAWEFARTYCPRLSELIDPLPYPGATRSLGERIVRNIILYDMETVYIQGPPGTGKTTILKELKKLFVHLGHKTTTALYDEALQSSYLLFGKDDEHWPLVNWMYTSALLLARSFWSNPPRSLADLQQFELDLKDFLLSRANEISAETLAAFILYSRPRQLIPMLSNVKHLIEATAVATIDGKDRGQLASKALARREKSNQILSQDPDTMIITLLPHPKMRDYSVETRTIAHTLKDKLTKNTDLDKLAPYLSKLRDLGLVFVGIEDLTAWVDEQIIAADTLFIDKYTDELAIEAQEWESGDDEGIYSRALRRQQSEEIILPPDLDELPDEEQKNNLKRIAACLVDKRFSHGATPQGLMVAWNEFKEHSAPKQLVLALCLNNVGRSQFFEGYYNQITGGQNALSAGVSTRINRMRQLYKGRPSTKVKYAMSADGIDVSSQIIKQLTPKSLERLKPDLAAIVVLCDEGQVPQYIRDFCVNNSIQLHIESVPDPDKMGLSQMLEIRDSVKVIAKKIANQYKPNVKKPRKRKVYKS